MAIQTLDDLQKVYDDFLLLEDRNLVKLLCGVTIANQLPYFDAVWIMLVAPPSSGKTECLQAFLSIIEPNSKKPMFCPIDDLTENTFASGQIRVGEETSLLFKLPPTGGILVFKDFTSILSKNEDARRILMGQLRGIYDNTYVKRTGNNKDVVWKGKIGAMGGCTEIIYEHLESLSAMGDRFAMYSPSQPDREEMGRFIMKAKRQRKNKDESRNIIKDATKEYIEYILSDLSKQEITITEAAEDKILAIADFCTRVRSGVIVNDKYKTVEFVPSKEMPGRMIEQLIALGTAFVAMRAQEPGQRMMREKNMPGADKHELSENDLEVISKVAFDSIPIKRRIALKLLAKHELGATTAGLAIATGYETAVVKGWLYQLNGLGICDRIKKVGPQGDKWKLKQEFVDIMVRFQHIQVQEGELIDTTEPQKDGIEDWDQFNEPKDAEIW